MSPNSDTEHGASNASPAVSPLSIFGSAHASRSPFQWDRMQEARQPAAPWSMLARRSMDSAEASRSARSLPPDGHLHEPLLLPLPRRNESADYSGAPGSGRPKAASFSTPSSSRSTPPRPGRIETGFEGVAPPSAVSRPEPTSPLRRGSLSNALHSISESVRSLSPLPTSWLPGSSQEAASNDAEPEHHSGSEPDLEAQSLLPSDFQYRLTSAQHPAFHQRLDAAPEAGPHQAAGDAPLKMSRSQRVGVDAVTGFINAVVSLPVMTSFAVIIFNDSFFAPWAGSLVRLVILSAAIHQAAFTLFSTIPFAVGQVQDVGLLFLSAISSRVVQMCKEAGADDDATLGTVLLTLALGTLLVGLLIVLVGQLRLAGMVQYMPLSVIGGYLGYVGYFVAASGASLATGRTFGSPGSWLQLMEGDVIAKLAPAVAGACLIWLVMHRSQSPWALPAMLVLMPVAFFILLYGPLQSNIQAARDAGWVTQSQGGAAPGHFWDVWSLFNFRKLFSGGIVWSAMPMQLPTVLALAFVVAFGSSLDVAAIQQDNPEELDYNKELTTVGISNILSALSGAGYTGSYIFSQTIFSMRAAVATRACGIVLVVCELAVFAAPFSVIEYLPLFFFGSLMLWIGYEIIKDWLVSAYQRMPRFEYATLWLTFAAIMVWGLELGIAAGLVLSACFFSFQYARVNVTAFSVVPSRSGVVRTFQQRTLLEVFAGRIVAVSLSGYIFFGSSVKIGDRVCQIVRGSLLASEETSREQSEATGAAADSGAASPAGSGSPQRRRRRREPALQGAELEGSIRNRAAAVLTLAPRFCLLDFRRVTGMDGTAGRQFATLRRRLQQMGIELVISHLPPDRPEVEELLLANGVIAAAGAVPQPGMCRAFPSLDQGLHHCEEVLLECAVHYGLCRPAPSSATLAEVLRTHLEYPRPLLPGAVTRYSRAAADMAAFMSHRQLDIGEVLFRPGDASDEMYVVETGAMLCDIDTTVMSPASARLAAAGSGIIEKHHHRLFQYGPGGIVGELDFFLQRPRSFLASAAAPSKLLVLKRPDFERMAARAPNVATLLQAAVLRCTSLSAAHALEALERAAEH